MTASCSLVPDTTIAGLLLAGVEDGAEPERRAACEAEPARAPADSAPAPGAPLLDVAATSPATFDDEAPILSHMRPSDWPSQQPDPRSNGQGNSARSTFMAGRYIHFHRHAGAAKTDTQAVDTLTSSEQSIQILPILLSMEAFFHVNT